MRETRWRPGPVRTSGMGEWLAALALCAACFGPAPAAAQSMGSRVEEPVCRPGAPVEPGTTLERALEVTGVRAASERVLHFRSRESAAAREQSDRWYPPYIEAMREREVWVDPRTGVERNVSDLFWPGSGGGGVSTSLVSASTLYAVRDTALRAASPAAFAFLGRDRKLDPWSVLLEWRADAGVRYAGECMARDYWRVVLERDAPAGPERLYLDPGSGYPLKIEYDETHYLWGQIRVEYLWATWVTPRGGGAYPASAHRLEDGVTTVTRTVSGPTIELVARADAPALAIPDDAPDLRRPPESGTSYVSVESLPDTVRVGPSTVLLVTPAYTETVTLQKDTVYLLDATTGEARSRADSTLIARLFPGRHPVTVVVTDVAWPHVSGVRFWVARGARIVTHRASVGFLREVTAHRWTRAPDALEASGAPRGPELRVQAVTDSLTLAGGAVRIYPIDGAASQGALMVHVPAERYLWASDFVQTLEEPSQYASEVWQAARRVGITPERFAAEHLALSPWSALEAVARE